MSQFFIDDDEDNEEEEEEEEEEDDEADSANVVRAFSSSTAAGNAFSLMASVMSRTAPTSSAIFVARLASDHAPYLNEGRRNRGGGEEDEQNTYVRNSNVAWWVGIFTPTPAIQYRRCYPSS